MNTKPNNNMNIPKIEKEVRWVHVNDLKSFDGNPRHNNKSAKIVAKSIQTYGYINPIIVNEELIVLAGNTRLKALKLLGVEEIDVIVVKGLNPDQTNGFVIADNRVGEFSLWNYSALERMYAKVDGDQLKQFGMSSVKDNKEALEALIAQ